MYRIVDYLRDFDKGLKKGTCKACNKAVPLSRTNLESHKRAHCLNVPASEKELFQKRVRTTVTQSPNEQIIIAGLDGNSTGRGNPINEPLKEDIDSALGKLFFRTGMSFRILDSVFFREFTKILNPSYAEVMPNSRSLSGVLLDKEYKKKFDKLTRVVEESEDIALITDGWTNCRGEHIVNFLVKAPLHPPIFYKSINTTGIVQDAENTSEAIIKVLEDLGPQKFSSVVTDNAPVLKSAWRKIEEKYPNVSAYCCAAHGINLLVKDILQPYENILTEASSIVKFFNNHHRARALFDEARTTHNSGRKLSVAVPTRWYSHHSSLTSVLESKFIISKICEEKNEELQQISASSTAVIRTIRSAALWIKLSNIIKYIDLPVNIIGKIYCTIERSRNSTNDNFLFLFII